MLVVGAILLAGVAAGTAYLLVTHRYETNLTQMHKISVSTSAYTFVHPLIGVSVPANQFSKTFPDMRPGIENIAKAQPAGSLERYSVYVRDLNSGNWTGINENDLYDPASLLKVVVAIAAYRQREDDPDYFAKPLTYTPAIARINEELAFAQPTSLVVGESYSVPSLVKKELADSDNGAAFTLLTSLDEEELDNVYADLSIPKPDTNDSTAYKLSASEYGRFFRILYNGTLGLNWSSPEQILEDLNHSTFKTGIVAGVPASVLVAHKYGEHVNGTNGVPISVELSDCGIVYATAQPYLLCVMTEGKDPDALAAFIARVSKHVYQQLRGTTVL
jgi:beta-lactamase class A